MRLIVIILLISVQWVFAHSPDLSTLMIYEQNGKTFLVIKGSLTAFEGEIDFHFGKKAYKTPEEFMQLVIKHFQKNFLIMMNEDTISLINPQVQLGHETTVFAELHNSKKNIESYFIRCSLFQDMPNNQCELIFSTKARLQKQYILFNVNNHEVMLKAENQTWIIEPPSTFLANKSLILWLTVLMILCITGFILKYRVTRIKPLQKMTL